jgi:subtilisin family serine protease
MKLPVRSIFNVLVIVGMLAVLVAPAAALGASVKPQTELSPENRYVVIFKGITTNAVGTNAISAMQASGGKLLFRYKAVLNGYAAELTPEQLALVEADPSVKQVFVDSIVTLDPVDEKPMLTHSYLAAPFTTQFNVTWGLDRLDQRYQPMNFAYSYPTTASTVHAYIIDTGINGKHPDFEGRVSGGVDLIDAANKAKDCNGHGTHVAGTVGSKTYGVAKKVQLHPVRVLDCEGSGYWSGVVAGIDWVAMNHKSPAVANLSLGGEYDEWINDAIENAVDSGVTMVVAAGNEADDACLYSPASAPSAITVGATDTWDYQTSFSNYGACVDVYAPGDAITSTSKDGSTAIYSGTSMASPHVAGLAALYLGIFPGASPADVAGYIINDATPGLISDLGVDSPDLLAFSMANAPVFALPISPSGTAMGKVQEMQWEEVVGATQYRVKVMNGGITLANMVTPSDCTDGYCYAMVGSFPAGGTYKWNVTSYVAGTWREAGPFVQFTTVSPGKAFNNSFKNNSSGFNKVNGKWTLAGGAINNYGVGGQITSMQGTSYYTDFTYEVRMKRAETCLYGSC